LYSGDEEEEGAEDEDGEGAELDEVTSAASFSTFITAFDLANNQATGYASQHIWCLSQARIN